MRRGLQLRRASFYHGAKIRNSAVFAPRGKLVGECLPQTLLCGLRRLSPPYRLPEKFGLADTIGRKPRCEVGVFFFGQPSFHNAAAVGCVVSLRHGL